MPASATRRVTIGSLVARGDEHVARARFGDAAVDEYFRVVEGFDPDAFRDADVPVESVNRWSHEVA